MQTDLLETVIETVPSSQQLMHLLDQCASVIYPVDAELSTALRDGVGRLGSLFGDMACIETDHGRLPANPSLRHVTDLLFRAFPAIKHEIRTLLTRVDQTVGRERFRDLF